MRCHHCQSEMRETDRITEGGACQTWYSCPVCASLQTISRPYQTPLRRIGNLQRCSGIWPESGYPSGRAF